MKDLVIFYSGGSGGHLLLHLLMLSGKYHTVFEKNEKFSTVLDKQWNITVGSEWKNNETWPINYETKHSITDLKKLYMLCNYVEDPAAPNFKYTEKICLYTDIQSQIQLSFFKRANWFVYTSGTFDDEIKRYRNSEWNKLYNNLKADDWPECSDISQLAQLPKYMREELNKNYLVQILTSDPPFKTETYKNDQIYHDAHSMIMSSHYSIKLQDLINSNGEILVETLGITINQQQLNLIDKWKKLHPPELLTSIGIK